MFTIPFLDLPALSHAKGTVTLPGSKSISNRVLLLAALSEGTTELQDLLDSDDTRVMLNALRELGCGLQSLGASLKVSGVGGKTPSQPLDLFMGNAGTAMRPLTAALAVLGGDFTLAGVPRMHERPIADLVDALRQLGCSIDYLGNDGFPPLRIGKPSLKLGEAIRVRGDVSSQFLTALLMASPLIARDHALRIDVVGELISKPYIDITLNSLRRFGVEIESNGYLKFDIPAHARYVGPGEIHVEGDASAASYFLAAGAISGLTGGGPVRGCGVGKDSVQGDVRFCDLLERMGAKITYGGNWIESTAGSEAVARGKFKALNAGCGHIPDAAMTLAIMALFADGETTLADIGSWRVKETDRIAAMATELRKLGATVVEEASRIKVTPPHAARLTPGAIIDTYDDHRMAMCFSLAALGGVPVRINDPRCVAKTFPRYFDVLASISSH